MLVLCFACWMGPLGVTLHFVWFGLGFACFVGILLFGQLKFVGFTVCLRWWVRVVLGIVLFILFPLVLLTFGFRWDPDTLSWSRPGLPLLCNLAGPVQHFKDAILDA